MTPAMKVAMIMAVLVAKAKMEVNAPSTEEEVAVVEEATVTTTMADLTTAMTTTKVKSKERSNAWDLQCLTQHAVV